MTTHPFPLRPLESDADLDAAIAVIDALCVRDDLSPEEDTYLDALSDLAEAYEHEHYAIPEPTPSEMLNHLMDARCVGTKRLARSARVSRVRLHHSRRGDWRLTEDETGRLCRWFHAPAGVFAPNAETRQAMQDAREGRVTECEGPGEMFEVLGIDNA